MSKYCTIHKEESINQLMSVKVEEINDLNHINNSVTSMTFEKDSHTWEGNICRLMYGDRPYIDYHSNST